MGFSNYAKQRLVAGKTVPLVLNQLSGDPTVHVEHLGESNGAFMAEALADSMARAGAPAVIRNLNARVEALAANRNTLAAHCIRGWEGVYEDTGEAAPATPEKIREFVDALPDDVVDSIIAFARNPSNFRERPAGDLRALAGKS